MRKRSAKSIHWFSECIQPIIHPCIYAEPSTHNHVSTLVLGIQKEKIEFIDLIDSLAPLPDVSAEEQAQQRLQAEEAEEQYQSVVRMLNTTTRKTQKRE